MIRSPKTIGGHRAADPSCVVLYLWWPDSHLEHMRSEVNLSGHMSRVCRVCSRLDSPVEIWEQISFPNPACKMMFTHGNSSLRPHSKGDMGRSDYLSWIKGSESPMCLNSSTQNCTKSMAKSCFWDTKDYVRKAWHQSKEVEFKWSISHFFPLKKLLLEVAQWGPNTFSDRNKRKLTPLGL